MQIIDRQGIADVLFSVVLIVALYVWNASAVVAIVSATVAYLGVAAIRTAGTSETLRDLAIQRQREVTTRRYHVLQYRTLPALPAPVADIPQIEYREPVETGARFVPAEKPEARAAALLWLRGLIDMSGNLDESRVLGPHTKAPGQIQYTKPPADALDLLTRLKIVRVGRGDMLFWTYYYPTMAEVVDKVQGRGVSV